MATMAKLKTKVIKIDSLIEYENNPRRNDKAVGVVQESIRKFGYTNPIIVNKDYVILAGHTRLKALKNEGETKVECIVVDDLTEEQERAFRIADNRVADFAAWDGDLLEAEMRAIDVSDWELFGFKDRDIRKAVSERVCTCPKCGKTFKR